MRPRSELFFVLTVLALALDGIPGCYSDDEDDETDNERAFVEMLATLRVVYY